MWPIYNFRHDKIKRACQVEPVPVGGIAAQHSAKEGTKDDRPRRRRPDELIFTYHHH